MVPAVVEPSSNGGRCAIPKGDGAARHLRDCTPVVGPGAYGLALAVCILGARQGLAQRVNVALVAGAMQYDPGADATYASFGLHARYFVSPAFRVGLLASTAHIGNPQPPRIWAAPGSDERIYRVAGMAEVATKPFHKSSFALRAMLGVFHSSGVIYQGPPPELAPYWGITDTNTGPSYGAGIGFELGPYSAFRFYLQGNFWRDHVRGSTGSNPEVLGGVGLDL